MSGRGPAPVLPGALLIMLAPLAYAQVPAEQTEYRHDASAAEPSASRPSSATIDDQSSEADHVAPQPPQQPMEAKPYRAMAAMMQMDDRDRFGRVLIDQLEGRTGQGSDAGAWEGQGWYGGDYDKLWFKTEGERVRDTTEDASAELFWDRIFSRWWSVQAGIREDFGVGPSRTWAAVGVQGLAPYWFDIEATAYLGEQGRTAIRFRAEYSLLFTQRLILQPEVETNLYGKSDPQRGIGSGLSDFDFGLRLRYEIRREFAPYLGLTWTRRFGRAADLARAADEDASDVRFVAGLHIWF